MNRPNPYFKKRESQSQDKDAPIMARIPQHFFSSPEGMFKELLKYELSVAMLPNTDPGFPFAFHAAIVYKDGADKVYTVGLHQHHGDPNPNYKAPNDTQETQNKTSKVRQKNRQTDKPQRKFKTKKSSKTYKQ